MCLPAPTTGATENRRLEFEVVTLCCIAETLNSVYLADTVRTAREPGLRTRTRAILKDEVNHAKLGWFFLARTGANLSWLSEDMPRILRATLHEELLESQTAHVADTAHGLYAGEELLAMFRASVEEVVLPGLEDAGLRVLPARQWLDQTSTAMGRSSAEPCTHLPRATADKSDGDHAQGSRNRAPNQNTSG